MIQAWFCLRPFDDREPPVQRQRRPGRELMRRRQEHRPGRVSPHAEALHLHAVGVQRHRHAFQASGIERLARAVVHGVFDEDPVARSSNTLAHRVIACCELVSTSTRSGVARAPRSRLT
jgi:hypothetical protein